MMKRLLAMLLCAVLVFSMVPVGAVAEGAGGGTEAPAQCKHITENWTAWGTGAGESTTLPKSGKYYLTCDIDLEKVLELNAASHDLSICMNGWDILGPAASTNRLFRLSGGAKLYLCNCHATEQSVITGSSSSIGGSVMYLEGASAELVNVNIEGNTSSAKGGAFWLSAGGQLTVTGGRIANNSSTHADGGGAIYVSGNESTKTTTVATLTNVTIAGNTTTGANGGGAVRVMNGTLNMDGCTVTGVVDSNTNAVGVAAPRAGALLLGSGAIATVSNSTFRNLKVNANKDGGAIMVEGAATNLPSLTLDNVTIENNIADIGGGVRVYRGQLTLKNKVVIKNNTNAAGAANNLYMDSADGKTIITKELGSGSDIGLYWKKGSAAAIATDAPSFAVSAIKNEGSESTKVLSADKAGQLTLIDPPAGAAAHTDTATYAQCGHKGAQTQVDYAPWYHTDSLPTTGGNWYLTGDVQLTGAVAYSNGVNITICLNGKNITAGSNTRMFRISENANVTLCDCSAHYEDETVGGQTVSVFKAGKLQGGNNGNNGGMAWVGKDTTAGATLNLFNVIVDNNRNTAGNAGGGAIYAADSAVNAEGCLFTNNTTSQDGGAIYSIRSSVSVKNTEFKNNHADNGGGGAVVAGTGTSVIVDGCIMTGNTAKNAGAIVAQGTDPKLTIKDSTITGNSAVNNGGGVFVGYNNSTTTGFVKLQGNVNITGNTKGANNAAGNVYLAASHNVVTLDPEAPLASTATFGVYHKDTTGKVVAANMTGSTLPSVTSDNAVLVLQLNGGELSLIEKPANAGVHADTAAYDKCGHKGAAEQAVYAPWYYTDRLPTKAGHYYLTADVTLAGTQEINNGDEVTLCLNGHDITRTGSGEYSRVYKVASKGTLNICDCTAGYKTITVGEEQVSAYDAGRLIGGTAREGAALHIQGGKDAQGNHLAKINLYDGILTGNTATPTQTNPSRGVVCVGEATFNMYGGAITGNGTSSSIVYVHDNVGKFNMSGGTIGGAIVDAAGTGIVTGNTINGTAGNAVVHNRGTTTISGGTIENHQLRGALVALGSITMSGGAIKNNLSSTEGAGVRVDAGSFTMTGGEISGNKTTGATSGGGGVRVAGDSTAVTISGGTITGNEAYNGAGILMVGGTVTVKTGDNGQIPEITNNKAANSGGGIFTNKGTVTLASGIIRENTAKYGAGMFVDSGNATTITLNGVQIIGNAATNSGSGIYMQNKSGSTFKLAGATKITDNLFKGKQNNLYLHNNRTVTLDSTMPLADAKIGVSGLETTIFQNGQLQVAAGADQTGVDAFFTSDQDHAWKLEGGKLYLVKSQATHHADHDEATWNAWTSWYSLPAAGNTNAYYYLTRDVSLDTIYNVTEGKAITICLNGHTITQTKEGNRVMKVEKGSLTICDCTAHTDAQGNYVAGKITGGSNGVNAGGGAIMVTGENAVLNLYGGIITGNKTEGHGGALVITGGADAQLLGGVITGNASGKNGAGVWISNATVNLAGTQVSGNTATGYGGGVYIDKSEVTFAGSQITNNTAVQGGGVFVNSSSTLTMENTTVSGNKADSAAGMAVGGVGTTFTMNSGSKIVNNESAGAAGGLVIQADATATLNSGSLISGNTSAKSGAGVYVSTSQTYPNAELVVDGCTITGNTAGTDGAGICNVGGKVSFKSGKIEGNTATAGAGGGIMAKNNEFKDADDKVIGVAEAMLIISGGQISNNTSKNEGAGIRMDTGKFTMTGGEVSGNKTTGETSGGAGMRVCGGSITGGKITGNEGVNGAGLLIMGDMTMTGVELSGNKATGSGGGLYVNAGAKVTMTDCTISGNTAVKGAGAYVGKGSLTMTGGAIKDNAASSESGAVGMAVGAAAFYMTSGEISGNTAENGGAIIVGTGNTLEITGGTLSGNKANTSGGAMVVQGSGKATLKDVAITGNMAKAGGAIRFNKGSLTVSGKTVIQNNTLLDGKTASNVQVDSADGSAITVKDLHKDAMIGVTMAAGKILAVSSGAVKANESNFTSDKAGYSFILTKDGGLEMLIPATNLTEHANTAGYTCAGHGDSKVEWKLWKSGNSLPTESGYYALAGDVKLEKFANIDKDAQVVLCLNGKTVDASVPGRAYRLSGGAQLTICDCTATTDKDGNYVAGKITGATNTAILIGSEQPAVTLNIYDGMITGNSTKDSGAAIVAQGGATVNIYGGMISGNKAEKNGGAIYLSKSTITMYGGKISGNTAGNEAGAVSMGLNGGTFRMTGGEISGNTANNGGAFVVGTGNTLEITGGTLSGNKANTSGGAMVVQGSGKATLKDVTITGNMAKAGGAIRFNKGSLTVSGKTVIQNNTLLDGKTASNVQVDSADGSAITVKDLHKDAMIGVTMAAGKTMAVLTDATADHANNFVSDKAGYIFRLTADGGLEHMFPATNVTGHADTAGYTCAGHGDSKVQWTLWESGNSLPTESGYYALTGNVMLEKFATVDKDAKIVLCLNGKTVDCTVSTRAYRLSHGAQLTICDCTAATDKDGNYTAGKITGATKTAILIGNEQPAVTLNIYDGMITGNKIEGSGAALVVQGGAVVNMYGGVITGNEATQNGAGVYNSGATFNLYGGVISNNIAGKEAGGVYNAGATFLLDGGIISGNKGGSNAGVVVGKESKATIKSGKITGNVSDGPTGGMVIQSKGYVEMTGGEISGNVSKAKNSGGGGVYISASGGTLIMSGGKITGNKASGYGGGLYVASEFVFSGGLISGNFSAKEGGGMYITNGKVTMRGGAISNNNTDVNGGGVCVRGDKGVFELYGGTISDNTALNTKSGTGHCGGVLAQGKGTFLMYGGTISGNKSTSMGGGVRVASNSVFNMYDGVITGNHSYRGGGVYTDCDMIFKGGQIIKNTCEYEGAGLYVSGGHLEMSGGQVNENENQKGSGGGICLRAKATMNMTGGEIVNNKAALGHGGGILIQSEASLTMEDGLISGNYGSKSGGGIRSSRCVVNILGGAITNNTSDLMGGAIYGENTLILKDCEISGNVVTAAAQGTTAGAAIKLANFTVMEAENVTFSNNTIVGRGAACDVAYRSDATFKNCTFTGNSATGNGGAINAMLICKVALSGCSFTGNSAIGMGGVLCAQSQSHWTIDDCTFEGNMSTISGGVLYGDAKSQVAMTNCVLKGNNATKAGSAICTNGGLYLTDTTITGNSILGNGGAVVLSGLGGDTESYLPGINQFKGDVVICENAGGDLLLQDQAFINIHGDGLGENATIKLTHPTGGITKCIVGPYDYVREGDVYTLSKGELSLSQADPVTEVVEEPDATEPDGTAQPGNLTGMFILIGSIVVLAAALWIIAILVWKKRKHVAQKIAAEGAQALEAENKK